MKTKPFYLLTLIALMLALYLSGCAGQVSAGDTPETAPEQVVQEFYDWYLGDRAAGPKDIHDSAQISAGLLARYDEAMQAATPGNVISFVCAQDFPDSVSVGTAAMQGDTAVVPVASSFGNTIELTLIPVDGVWQIDDVTCK